MNTPPFYLQVGPVAIHLHSRETSHKPTSLSNHLSSQRTLDVQELIFFSPNDGTSIQELNEAISSNSSNAPSSTVPSPVSPSSPPPSSASVPSPSIPSSVSNVGNLSSASGPAPAPPSPPPAQQPDVQKNSAPGPQPTPTPTPSSPLPQGTKDSTSSHIPASSPITGNAPQPTILAGPTIVFLSEPGIVGPTGQTSTSSLETASSTVASNATSNNATSIIAGSILAAILGIVLFVAIITFFLRMRARRRAEDELSWDPEPNSGHTRGNDNDSFFDSPPFQATGGQIPPSDRPGPIITLQSELGGLRTRQSSYLATPELAHTTGPLTVTNLMPGDVPLSANTSVFMASRPGSAQVTPRIDNSAPRFMRLQDGGLPVPWSRDTPESANGPPSRPKAWPSRFSAASLKNIFSPSAPKSAQLDSPQHRTSAANMKSYYKLASNIQLPEPAKTADRTWSGTIRTGITNAWSAMMGASGRPYEPPDNNLTPIPPRPNRRLSSKSGISTLESLSTASSRSVTPRYPMEEKRPGHPITRAHSYGLTHEALAFDGTIKEEDEESDVSSLPFPGSSTPKNAHADPAITDRTSVPCVPQVPGDVVDRPSSVPRLPTIRPLSRAWTLRSEGFISMPESDDGYRSAFNQMINERKQEYDRRLAELEAVAAGETSRPVMSRASTTSLMTESTALSRESSVMDDCERRAKQMLRMRRKRAMALSASSIGNGRVFGS